MSLLIPTRNNGHSTTTASGPEGSQTHILYLDDRPDTAAVRELNAADYKVLVAEIVREAERIIEDCKPGKVAAAVIDVFMEGNSTALSLAQELTDNEIPVILYTSASSRDDLGKLLEERGLAGESIPENAGFVSKLQGHKQLRRELDSVTGKLTAPTPDITVMSTALTPHITMMLIALLMGLLAVGLAEVKLLLVTILCLIPLVLMLSSGKFPPRNPREWWISFREHMPVITLLLAFGSGIIAISMSPSFWIAALLLLLLSLVSPLFVQGTGMTALGTPSRWLRFSPVIAISSLVVTFGSMLLSVYSGSPHAFVGTLLIAIFTLLFVGISIEWLEESIVNRRRSA